MIFRSTAIRGAVIVEPELAADSRGSFARTYCAQEFAANGIPTELVQASLSRNRRRGTVRGMHFSWPPAREQKLVRCTRGRLRDVVVDLRPESPSFLEHIAVELDADTGRQLFIDAGLAHGFQTLVDDTEVVYQMSSAYAPELAGGVRWNDPAFGIDWPLHEVTILERDASYPDFDPASFVAALRRRAPAPVAR
jgi:dTDP-4-dehydrorhamnose 3,5-epimerase